MMRKRRPDIKFILYQTLYIFVICVVAIKGANLDLQPVIDTQGKEISYISEDSLRHLYEQIQQSVIVDTSRFVIIDKKVLEEDAHLRDLVKNMPPRVDMTQYMPKHEVESKYELKKDEPEKIVEKPEIQIGEVMLTQFYDNTVNNKGDVPITIAGVTIPAHATRNVLLHGENSVVITAGNVSKTVSVMENQKPKLTLQAMVPLSGDEVHLAKLQQVVGYRATITDDHAGNLDVKVTGAVSSKVVKQSDKEIVVDITLNAFPSKQSFDNYINGNEKDRYQSTFTVMILDKIAPHKIQQVGMFYWTEW